MLPVRVRENVRVRVLSGRYRRVTQGDRSEFSCEQGHPLRLRYRSTVACSIGRVVRRRLTSDSTVIAEVGQ